jgi:hypothetical protein
VFLSGFPYMSSPNNPWEDRLSITPMEIKTTNLL